MSAGEALDDFQVAAERGDLTTLMASWHRRDAAAQSRALEGAAEHGHIAAVQALIPLSLPERKEARALCLAARKGHLACVEALIPVSRMDLHGVDAMHGAASNGHLLCVRALMAAAGPDADVGWALVGAAGNGHLGVVRELLPRGAVAARCSAALVAAIRGRHTGIVELLLPFPHTPDGLAKALAETLQMNLDDAVQRLVARCTTADVDRAFRMLMENRYPEVADALAGRVSLALLGEVSPSDRALMPALNARRASEAEGAALRRALPVGREARPRPRI